MKKYFSTDSMGFVFYILFVFCTISSCKTTYFVYSQLPKNHIIIGSYGGFTGMDINHIYLRNGGIYKTETLHGTEPKLSFVKRQSKKQAHTMFKAARQISFQDVTFAEPANINTYIEFRRLLLKDCYYQWDGRLDSTNQNFKALSNLMQWHQP